MTQTLKFETGTGTVEVPVVAAYNAGYTGRDQRVVADHISELALQGVTAPGQVPTVFSVPSYMNLQVDAVEVEHDRTSGEVEWALVYRGEEQPLLLTVASDHTDRALEAHDVTASKQISPNILGTQAWEIDAGTTDLDDIVMRAEVRAGGQRVLLQEGRIGDLISPLDWVARLADIDRLQPGIVVLGGTVPMIAPDAQFADGWQVTLERPAGDTIVKEYEVHRMVPSLA